MTSYSEASALVEPVVEMRVVYLIMCHASRTYVEDLFALLFNDNDFFLFHVDKKAPIALLNRISEWTSAFPNVASLPSRLCSWGGYSLVDVELGGIVYAIEYFPGWSHIIFLSEQHLPLHDGSCIAQRLEPQVSYVENTPFQSMSQAAQIDLAHRFEMEYKELPGVGGFGISPRKMTQNFFDVLHHGSQWMILSREAAVAISSSLEDPFWKDFETAILADETAIQTFLANHSEALGLQIVNANPTFVAWPHLSGTRDLTFSEENFFEAIQDNYLFIRKRPVLLPPSVEKYYKNNFERNTLRSVSEDADDGRSISLKFSSLFNNIVSEMDSFAADIFFKYDVVNDGIMAIRMTSPSLGGHLSVQLISFDAFCGILILVWNKPHVADLYPIALGQYFATVMKVRIHGLFGAYQINVPAHPDRPFEQLDSKPGITETCEKIKRYFSLGAQIYARHADIIDEANTAEILSTV